MLRMSIPSILLRMSEQTAKENVISDAATARFSTIFISLVTRVCTVKTVTIHLGTYAFPVSLTLVVEVSDAFKTIEYLNEGNEHRQRL